MFHHTTFHIHLYNTCTCIIILLVLQKWNFEHIQIISQFHKILEFGWTHYTPPRSGTSGTGNWFWKICRFIFLWWFLNPRLDSIRPAWCISFLRRNRNNGVINFRFIWEGGRSWFDVPSVPSVSLSRLCLENVWSWRTVLLYSRSPFFSWHITVYSPG